MLLRKTVSGIVLMLLLTSMLSTAFNIQPVKAESTTWTVDDDLQDCPDADFTKIQDAVNVASDGDTVLVYSGTYSENVYVNKRLTIKSHSGPGMTIVEAAYTHSHVFCVAADHVSISGFTVKGATRGPETLEKAGIYLYCTDYCNISNNIAMNNDYGICLPRSSNNLIMNNNANHNKHIGIYLSSSSSNNLIANNNVSNNHNGIVLSSSSNNIIANNYAWSNFGGIDILSLSNNNTIINNDVSNNCNGIYLSSSSNNLIVNNHIQNNYGSGYSGIDIRYSSSNNIVTNNGISGNTYGIHLVASSNNTVYHNNIVDNAQQVSISNSKNIWDNGYPSGGNYWSDYTDVDLYSGPYQNESGNDGIWDHPYVIDENNQDRYPLVNPWTPTPPPKFRIGDWVRTTANLNVREGPGLSYTIIDTMPLGTIGQIVGGPVEADGFVWWDVDYAVGVRGWSAENWLEFTSPNQPPVANFSFYPQNPKAGEEVTFNSSSSYDPDGEILFYEWDWNGDGDFDDYTESSTITFWWLEEGTYNVTLRVIDDKGAMNSSSKKITVHKSATSETMIVLASIWWRFRYGWDDGRAMAQIDRWIRDGKGEPLDWLKPYNAGDLAYILNKEISPDHAPGLTYKTFARSKIFEDKLIHQVFRFYISVTHQATKEIFKYVLDGVWKLGVQITLEGIMKLHPLVGAGLKTIYLGVQMHSLSEAFKRINKYWYTKGLADYFVNIGLFQLSPEKAWNTPVWGEKSPKDWVNKAISARAVPLVEGEEREKTLEETRFYFEELWKEYGKEGDFGVGLYEKFRQQNREQLKNLILSKLRETFGARELVDRRIVHVASPVELRVYDSEGRITGVINGEEKVEIPNSVYDSETKTATIFLLGDSLKYEVAGTGAGTYGLEITSMENGQIINFTATDIPTSPDTIYQYTIDWDALSLGEEGVTVMVDSDGDGVFEHTFASDSELTRSEYLAALGDLNGDGKVDMRDLSIVALAFGSYPRDPRWNPIADVNKDNKINMKDLVIICKNFGKTYA